MTLLTAHIIIAIIATLSSSIVFLRAIHATQNPGFKFASLSSIMSLATLATGLGLAAQQSTSLTKVCIMGALLIAANTYSILIIKKRQSYGAKSAI